MSSEDNNLGIKITPHFTHDGSLPAIMLGVQWAVDRRPISFALTMWFDAAENVSAYSSTLRAKGFSHPERIIDFMIMRLRGKPSRWKVIDLDKGRFWDPDNPTALKHLRVYLVFVQLYIPLPLHLQSEDEHTPILIPRTFACEEKTTSLILWEDFIDATRAIGIPPPDSLDSLQSIVFIGRNGSGKTRIGRSLVERMTNTTDYRHRYFPSEFNHPGAVFIPARRNVAEKVRCSEYESTNVKQLLTTAFEAAVSAVSQQDELVPGFRAAARYIVQNYLISRDNTPFYGSKSSTLIDEINSIWKLLFPRFALFIQHVGSVHPSLMKLEPDADNHCLLVNEELSDTSATVYSAHKLSDGQLECIMLVFRVLQADPLGVIVVDEPEAHLHRFAVQQLWDVLQSKKPLVFFVYLTHDLHFATSRHNSTIFSTTDVPRCATVRWLPPNDEIPSDIAVQIMGASSSLLVEGNRRGSRDYRLYHSIYRNHHAVIPMNSSSVITTLLMTWKESDFSKIIRFDAELYGLIDLDYHTERELKDYERNKIFPIKMADIENLLCTPQVVREVARAKTLSREDINKCLTEAADIIIEVMSSKVELIAAELAQMHKLNSCNKSKLNSRASEHITKTYQEKCESLRLLIESRDITKILRNLKAVEKDERGKTVKLEGMLIDRVARTIKSDNGEQHFRNGNEYQDFVIHELDIGNRQAILRALQPHFPERLPGPWENSIDTIDNAQGK